MEHMDMMLATSNCVVAGIASYNHHHDIIGIFDGYLVEGMNNNPCEPQWWFNFWKYMKVHIIIRGLCMYVYIYIYASVAF